MNDLLDMENIKTKWIPRKYLKQSKHKSKVENYVKVRNDNDFIPVVDSKQTIFWTRLKFLKKKSTEGYTQKVRIFDSRTERYTDDKYLKNNQNLETLNKNVYTTVEYLLFFLAAVE